MLPCQPSGFPRVDSLSRTNQVRVAIRQARRCPRPSHPQCTRYIPESPPPRCQAVLHTQRARLPACLKPTSLHQPDIHEQQTSHRASGQGRACYWKSPAPTLAPEFLFYPVVPQAVFLHGSRCCAWQPGGTLRLDEVAIVGKQSVDILQGACVSILQSLAPLSERAFRPSASSLQARTISFIRPLARSWLLCRLISPACSRFHSPSTPPLSDGPRLVS